jgi:hypothetical protein
VYADKTGVISFDGATTPVSEITVLTRVAIFGDAEQRSLLELATDQGPIRVVYQGGQLRLN